MFRIIFALGLVVGLVAGCGGGEPVPKVPHATDETAQLSIYVGFPSDTKLAPVAQSLKSAIIGRLVGLGYNVADDASGADVVASTEFTVTAKTGFIAVYVNGVQKVSYEVHAALTATSESQILSTAAIDFDAEDGASSDQVDVLVRAISGKRLEALARARRERKARKAKAETEKREREERERIAAEEAERKAREEAEETAWKSVTLTACTQPTEFSGCEPLEAFLKKFPMGQHADDAKAAVEKGHVALGLMHDENDWTGAHIELCKAPKASNDCDAVNVYLMNHPTGKHVDEGREAAAAVRDTLEKLRKKEEAEEARRAKQEEEQARREAARAEREERQERQKQCREDCRDSCLCFARPCEPCVAHCMRMNQCN